jgi:hypothetical protein
MEEIEHLCISKNIEYIEAVVIWCENNNFEIEFAADLIKKNPLIKSKIQIEAENLNFLKRPARLPI